MIPNTELELTLQEVIKICSKVRLADKTLTFDSFGSNDLRISTEAFLDKHGFDVFDGERIINELTEKDYVKGPVDNYVRERKQKLWIFITNYRDLSVYVKLMVYNKRRCVAVISLHDNS